MGFFDDDDDPFDEIVKGLFGGSRGSVRSRGRQKFSEGEEEDRIIDFIEDGKNIYLIFELPGFSIDDVSVTIKGKEINIIAKKKEGEGVVGYLKEKIGKGIRIRKNLPDFVDSKRFDFTMKNGVLEIKLNKY